MADASPNHAPVLAATGSTSQVLINRDTRPILARMSWITAIVAVYGASLSTVAIVWQIAAWRSRVVGRVRVFVTDNMMTYSEFDGEEGPFIMFQAVNGGEKPVRLKAIGVSVKGAEEVASREVRASSSKPL